MAQLTLRQICSEALQEINITAFNETPKAADVMRVVRYFNRLVDMYKARRLYIQKVSRTLYPVTPLTAEYTWGVGGTWNGYRPEPGQIVAATFVATNISPANPLETDVHVYADEEWPRVRIKTIQSNIIWGMWTDYDFPLAKVEVYPVPTVTAQIAVYSGIPIDELPEDQTGLNTTVSLPPGYRNLFILDLAFNISGPFEKPVSPDLVVKRREAKQAVKASNQAKPHIMRLPPGLRRGKGMKILQGDM